MVNDTNRVAAGSDEAIVKETGHVTGMTGQVAHVDSYFSESLRGSELEHIYYKSSTKIEESLAQVLRVNSNRAVLQQASAMYNSVIFTASALEEMQLFSTGLAGLPIPISALVQAGDVCAGTVHTLCEALASDMATRYLALDRAVQHNMVSAGHASFVYNELESNGYAFRELPNTGTPLLLMLTQGTGWSSKVVMFTKIHGLDGQLAASARPVVRTGAPCFAGYVELPLNSLLDAAIRGDDSATYLLTSQQFYLEAGIPKGYVFTADCPFWQVDAMGKVVPYPKIQFTTRELITLQVQQPGRSIYISDPFASPALDWHRATSNSSINKISIGAANAIVLPAIPELHGPVDHFTGTKIWEVLDLLYPPMPPFRFGSRSPVYSPEAPPYSPVHSPPNSPVYGPDTPPGNLIATQGKGNVTLAGTPAEIGHPPGAFGSPLKSEGDWLGTHSSNTSTATTSTGESSGVAAAAAMLQSQAFPSTSNPMECDAAQVNVEPAPAGAAEQPLNLPDPQLLAMAPAGTNTTGCEPAWVNQMLLCTAAYQAESTIFMSGQQVSLELGMAITEEVASTFHVHHVAPHPVLFNCAYCCGTTLLPDAHQAYTMWADGLRCCPTVQALAVGLPPEQCPAYARALRGIYAGKR